MTSSARPRRLFWVGVAMIVAVFAEAGAYIVEWASPRVLQEPIRRRADILREQTARIESLLDSTRARREVLDSSLGWRYRAGYSSPTDHLNAQGLRARRPYDPLPPSGTMRIAAFGDSFVYGNEVADDDAWCAILGDSRGKYEVLNYGVGGYGVDQSFLRYQREGLTLRPDVVLIGFATDDLRRLVNVYRRFISSLEWPLAKPRFLLRPDTSLVLVPNPLSRRSDYERLLQDPFAVRGLGAHDQWYSATVYEHPLYDWVATLRVSHALWQRLSRRLFDPGRLFKGRVFNERSPAFALQIAIFGAFAAAVKDGKAVPVIVLLPDRGSVENVRVDAPAVYAPLKDSLVRHGMTVWDANDAFMSTDAPVASLFAPGGHYSPSGNRIVARWLEGRLDSLRIQTH